MKYANGNDIRLGDAVRLQNGALAEIVALGKTQEFDPRFPASEWAHALGDGVLVRTANGARVRYDTPVGDAFVQVGPA